jgi:hypothetical protein
MYASTTVDEQYDETFPGETELMSVDATLTTHDCLPMLAIPATMDSPCLKEYTKTRVEVCKICPLCKQKTGKTRGGQGKRNHLGKSYDMYGMECTNKSCNHRYRVSREPDDNGEYIYYTSRMAVGDEKRRAHHCRKCGQPSKNHTCQFPSQSEANIVASLVMNEVQLDDFDSKDIEKLMFNMNSDNESLFGSPLRPTLRASSSGVPHMLSMRNPPHLHNRRAWCVLHDPSTLLQRVLTWVSASRRWMPNANGRRRG